MTVGMMTHGADALGERPATGRQDGPEPQHAEPGRRWGGKSGLKYTQYGRRQRWELHPPSLAWVRLALS